MSGKKPVSKGWSTTTIAIVGAVAAIVAAFIGTKPWATDSIRGAESKATVNALRETTSSPSQTPVSISVEPKVLPPASNASSEFEKARNQLREKEGLRPLTTLETGKSSDNTPDGTFFFGNSIYIAFYVENRNHHQFKDNPLLETTYGVPSVWGDWEVHRHADGSFSILACVTQESAAGISSGQKPVDAILFNAPWGEVMTMIELPIDRIVKAENRYIQEPSKRQIDVLDVTVAPVDRR